MNPDPPAINLVVPPAIEDVILKFDQANAVVGELTIKGELIKARDALVDITDAENMGVWAEVLAFALAADAYHYSPWKTYFGPMGSRTYEDGRQEYWPDIAGTHPEVIGHWARQARRLKHPVLKARYADLAWDMSRAITNIAPDPDMARIAIDAYLASLDLRPDAHRAFEAAIRALDLAQMLRDTGRIENARKALLELHRIAVQRPEGLWRKAFDRLIDDKHAGLKEEETDRLVADLEALLTRFSNTADPKQFDPHSAEDVAKRLIGYHSKRKKHEERVRLQQIVGRSFEHAASLADPMLASSFLQTAVTAYREARLPEESKRARVEMEEKIEASHAQMQTHTFEIPISSEGMEQFLGSVVTQDIGSTFARIASKFLHSRERLEAEVRTHMETSPLMAMISQTIMAENHVAATVGSVEDDPFGRVIRQAVQTISFDDMWLLAALHRAIEVHSLTPHHFVGWIARTRLYDDLVLLMEGVAAWFQGDFVKAIHVLIPQVEMGLRKIVDKLGRPITKAHPKIPGASVVVNMGDILYMKEVTDVLGRDITLHLLTLYADPRGFNLRNEMAHGFMSSDQMDAAHAARIIHTLMLLGVWDQLAEARKVKVETEQPPPASST